jgi:hypothetical protein
MGREADSEAALALRDVSARGNVRSRTLNRTLDKSLETQHVGPLSIHNYSDSAEGNFFTGNGRSMSYYWNDETTFSNAEGSIPTLEVVGTYLHCLANHYLVV